MQPLPGGMVWPGASRQLSSNPATITYYLRHREEVDACLAEEEAETENWRQEAQTRFDTRALGTRLLARM